MTVVPEKSELKDLYRELILDHARKPRNFGRIENATHVAEGINPLCGDKLSLYLLVDSEQRITEAGFEGSGCAISMASASLMTETISNLSVTDANTCYKSVTTRLTTNTSDSESEPGIDLSHLRALDGVRDYPSRVKCATLAWHTLHAALFQSQATATTE